MTKNKEHLTRKETHGDRIWYPLPRYILAIVFDQRVAHDLLGYLNVEDKGDWDKENGIYVHKKSGRILCLAAQSNSLEEMQLFIKNDISMSRLLDPDLEISERNMHLKRVVSYLGERIAIVHVREYDVTRLSELKVNHFSPTSSHLFVSNEGSRSASIVVDSVPSYGQPHTVPASHPALESEHIVNAKARSTETDSPLSRANILIDAMFSPAETAQSKYVPTANASVGTEPIEHTVVNYNGRTEILAQGPVKQIPIATFSNGTVTNTASTISNGTVQETTLDGFGTNKDPDRAGCFFFPHPPYLGSMFTAPMSILRDPKAAAVIITLAVANAALRAGSGNTKTYTHNYKYVNNVIDNQSASTDLFGGG